MNDIDIYYDKHTRKEYLSFIPFIFEVFIEKLKEIYGKDKQKFRSVTLLDEEFSDNYDKSLVKKFIQKYKRSPPNHKNDRLLRLEYAIKHDSTSKFPNITYEWLGLALLILNKHITLLPCVYDYFNRYMLLHESKKFDIFLLEWFELIIKKTNPTQISAYEDLFRVPYEYVQDPYWLALELKRDFIDEGTKDEEYIIDKSDGQWELLEQIKQVITVEEILEICYKYGYPTRGYYIKYYPETGGIAYFSEDELTLYPRFFIREEIRKRGVSIPTGYSESSIQRYEGGLWEKKKKSRFFFFKRRI